MKIQIENKSLLVGILIGVGAMLLMGFDSAGPSETGRYQLATGGNNIYVYIYTVIIQIWILF